METEAGRLQSFFQRGRLWPHTIQNWLPNPATLSKAGFYFNPISTVRSSDNVTCYLCLQSISNWTQQDEPKERHLQESPECPLHHLKQSIEAKLKSFGDWWPHDDSFLATVQRLAECGFHYAPAEDSNDMVQCAHCDLALDGWERSDDPMEEHLNRAPKCGFFTGINKTKKATNNRSVASSKRRGRAVTETIAAAESDVSFVSTVSSVGAATRKRRNATSRESDVSVISLASSMATTTRSTRRRKVVDDDSRETIADSDLSFSSVATTATARSTTNTVETQADQSIISEASSAATGGRGRGRKEIAADIADAPKTARGRRKVVASSPVKTDDMVIDTAAEEIPVAKIPAKRGRPKRAVAVKEEAEQQQQQTKTTRGRKKKAEEAKETVEETTAAALAVESKPQIDDVPINDFADRKAGTKAPTTKAPTAKRTYKRAKKDATPPESIDSADVDPYDPTSVAQTEPQSSAPAKPSAANSKPPRGRRRVQKEDDTSETAAILSESESEAAEADPAPVRRRVRQQKKPVNYSESANNTRLGVEPAVKRVEAFDVSGPIIMEAEAVLNEIPKSADNSEKSTTVKRPTRASSAAFSLSFLPEDINNQRRAASFCDAREDILNLSSIVEDVPAEPIISRLSSSGMLSAHGSTDDIVIVDVPPIEISSNLIAKDSPTARQQNQSKTDDFSIKQKENSDVNAIESVPVVVKDDRELPAAGFNLDGIQIEEADLDGTVEEMLRKMIDRELRRLESENEELMLEFIREYDRKVEYLKSQIEVLPQ